MNEQHGLVKYETEHGEVTLSPAIIKAYLVSGDPEKVTDQELMLFLNLCRYQRLNPFLRDAYLIKFGNYPASMVTGKDVFTKRAAGNANCTGWEAGVIVESKGTVHQRKGTFLAPGETLLGGWALVHRKDWSVPLETSVSLSEYMRLTTDGKPQRNWREMPATMIRKVALVQALREAMPADFQGLYAAEEMPVDMSQLSEKPVVVPPLTAAPTVTSLPVAEAPSTATISKAQQQRMFAIASGQVEIVRAVLKEYGVEHSGDVKRVDYDDVCAEITKRAQVATGTGKPPGPNF